MVPLGTDRDAAMVMLRKEKLDCRGVAAPITCGATSPNVLGLKQWMINLEFDTDGRLSDARIAIWNIFL
jgi:hypothetical protein